MLLWRAGNDQRHAVQLAAALALTAKPGARPGIAPDHAADLLCATLSPEMYLLLVRDRGWSTERFAEWADTSLRALLIR